MPVRCPRCRTKYGNKLFACPTCSLRNRDTLSFVPEDIVSRYYGNFTGQKYLHPRQELERELTGVLAQGNLAPTTLVMEPDDAVGYFSTFVGPSGEVSVKYNSKLFDYMSDADVRQFLKHEACHIFTLPTSETRVPQTSPELQAFLLQHCSSYDEFLVHSEFLKRWPGDVAFRDFKIRDLDNQAITLYSVREAIAKNQFQNLVAIFQNLSAIFQELVYMRLADQAKLQEWSEECEAKNVASFLEFWFQDFQFISSQALPRDKLMNLAQLSATLALSVNPVDLLMKDKLNFDPSARDTYQNFWNARADLQDRVLIAAWIGRLV